MHKATRRFKLIYLAPALALIALMSWALASPIGSSPDDNYHLASIWCANAANTAACEPGHTPNLRKVPPLVKGIACFAGNTTVSAACQDPYIKLGSKPTVEVSGGSFDNEYPPIYYASMSVFVGSDVIGSALLMRLVNILLFIGITTALFTFLPRRRRPALIWSWVISVVPLGLFLLASNNPSGWALIGVGSAWMALLSYFETSGSRKVALGVLFALSAVMAAGARADSALYVVFSVVVVFILTFSRTKRYLISALLPLSLCVVAVYFFFSSRQATVISQGLGNGTEPGGRAPIGFYHLLTTDLMNVPQLWAGALGSWGLGWLDTIMPPVVTFCAVSVFVGISFVGLSRNSSRKIIVVFLVAFALWFIPTYVLVKGLNLVGENVQPRYLLPLMVVFAGVALFAVDRKGIYFSRLQLTVVVLMLTVAQSIAMYTNMRRYIAGTQVTAWSLDADMKWWWNVPFSPMFVWITGSLAFTALLIVLLREISKPHRAETGVDGEIRRDYELA